MLSRRNIRVKVMQALYSSEHSNGASLDDMQKMLGKSIAKSYTLLYFSLSLLVRIAEQVKKEQQIKTAKFLPTEDDLRFSDRLANNPFIAALKANRNMQERLKLTMNEDEALLVKNLWKDLADKPEYRQYLNAPAGDPDAERAILLFIFDKIIHKSEAYRQFVEDNFPESVSEVGKINFTVGELLEKFSLANPDSLAKPGDSEAIEQFARELLERTCAHEPRFRELIEPKLKNWDMDRIASLDMILMKMALCELLYFENIPVKVSINEYIDISKIYSTAKSKDFINGILDNIMQELRQRNEIEKTGRGLVE